MMFRATRTTRGRTIMIRRFLYSQFILIFTLLLSVGANAQSVNPDFFSGLKWRNVGPFRGGRVSAVSGAIGQPGTYYMGLPLGGVWKTTSAGQTWVPIFDDIKEVSSVGAVEVAPSNPNVIYVGMGDLITGGGINEGNGVYKSTDAGKTWKHLGLDETKQIPSILVDPKDPDLVLVAAQGNIRTTSNERGVYRSTDGGTTWKKTLFVDGATGIQKLASAFDRPDVILATTVRHYNSGGAGRGNPNGGVSTGGGRTALFKSTDEGLTWKEISGHGLPNLSGRTCVAVANNTNAQRMFIVGNFGLYRSDDGGANWTQMDAADRRIMNGQGGYNCGVYVNPKNPDIVYVINTCSYRSLDGGKTFTGFKGAPGGDDPQQMWLDPTDGNRLFFGTDQGATISLDGGENWSSWYNQPSAQVYHISVDNQYPYWIYATQQDSGCIGTSSRGNLGAVTALDWLPHPGYEFGYIVADPLNPKITYAGGEGGGIVKVTYPSGQRIDVSPSVNGAAGLRKVGNQPLLFSPTNPRELFAGFQYLMSTTDGGLHWRKLSPDLGYPKGATPPKPDVPPVTRPGTTNNAEMDEDDEDEEPTDQFGAGGGGAIQTVSSSSLDGNVIWIGTNNGLIKLTRNHGATWEDVTIPRLPNPTRADICCIEASHHDLGTAYAAVDLHNTGDLTPHFFRTRDFGKTWVPIVQGLPKDQPSGSYARVIRADTQKAGLLFAGTESSMYVSFDDGEHWQSLMLNLPNTSYRDIAIKGNDLVVGTYGRSFWILDDYSPLRQVSASMTSSAPRLFEPASAIRVRRNVNGDTPFPPEIPHALNAPVGALLYYYLGEKPAAPITIEIKDRQGHVVRHMTSEAAPASNEPAPPIPDFWVEKPRPMPTERGTNRINWNLRYDSPFSSGHSYDINANPGETPASPEGPLVAPGEYRVILHVDGKSYEQVVKVVNDPRSPASGRDLGAQCDLQQKLYFGAQEAWSLSHQAAAIRKEVSDATSLESAAEFAKAAEAFDEKLLTLGGTISARRGFGGRGGSPGQAPSFANINSSMIRLLGVMELGDMRPNDAMEAASSTALRDLGRLKQQWSNLLAKDLPAFNAVLVKFKLKPIAAPVAGS